MRHREPGMKHRRWDDPLQVVVNAQLGAHRPWSEVAQRTEEWKLLEASVVQRALRIFVAGAVPDGRFMANPMP